MKQKKKMNENRGRINEGLVILTVNSIECVGARRRKEGKLFIEEEEEEDEDDDSR